MELSNPEPAAFGRPEAIVFDWDNTLVDTWPVIREALNTTLQAHGMAPWSMVEVRRRVRKSTRDRFPELFGDDWEAASDLFYARYNEIHMDMLVPISAAADALARLSRAGIYLAVVSNKRGDILRNEAEHLGWDRYFGVLVGATDAERDKPARDPVDMALAPPGIAAGPSVWFVGDADIDMECARNAGCTGVLLGDHDPRGEAGSDAVAALHFSDGMALCKFIDKL